MAYDLAETHGAARTELGVPEIINQVINLPRLKRKTANLGTRILQEKKKSHIAHTQKNQINVFHNILKTTCIVAKNASCVLGIFAHLVLNLHRVTEVSASVWLEEMS